MRGGGHGNARAAQVISQHSGAGQLESLHAGKAGERGENTGVAGLQLKHRSEGRAFFAEDSQAEVDCNFVMTGDGRFVEIQATAEKGAFSAEQYGSLVALASGAMKTLFARQREAIERARP